MPENMISSSTTPCHLLYVLSFVSLASPDEAILRKRYSPIANKSFPATHALLKYSGPPGSTVVFNSSTKIPYPQVSSHQRRNLPILCQTLSMAFRLPPIYLPRRRLRAPGDPQPPSLPTSQHDHKTTLFGCVMMCFGLAWIAKQP